MQMKAGGKIMSAEEYKESLETYFSIQLPELPKSW